MAIVTPGTFSLTALANEINNDPKALGYSALVTAGDYPAIAKLMNTSPEPIAAGSQEQIYRNYSDTRDLAAALVLTEVAGLTQGNRDFLALIFSTAQVKTGDANIRTQVPAVFAAGATSRTNLNNAAQKNASRSEALFGDGRTVTDREVYLALHPGEQ
jgi:hypothetical protein